MSPSIFFLIHLLGLAGAVFGIKKKLPAGAMIGAFLFVVVANLTLNLNFSYPSAVKQMAQILSGLLIGTKISREDAANFKIIWKPALLLTFFLVAINLSFAYIISKFTILSASTSIFATAMGGVGEMALIAGEFNANTHQVAILQVFRFAFVIIFFPLYIRKINNLEQKKTPSEQNTEKQSPQYARFFLSVASAFAGAIVANLISLPAANIIGPIIAVIILNLTTELAYIPPYFRSIIQLISGCYIASEITRAALLNLSDLILPMILILVELFVMTFGSSFIITKLTGMDKVTSLFSCIPGGIAEMGMVAEELGLDLPKIIMMHTCRNIVVVSSIPIMLKLLFR